MARLILRFKENVLDVYDLPSSQSISIGRHHSNRIVIDNLAVSGYHARIDSQDDALHLTDLQSKNGTFVNDERVTERTLGHEDTILVGKHALVVDLYDSVPIDDRGYAGGATGAPSPMSETKTMFLDTSHGRQMRGEEPPPPPDPEPVYADYDSLCFLKGGDGDLPLTQSQVTIGRNKDADIVVGGFWGLLAGDPAATISKQAGDYFLRFSGGVIKPKRNGTGVKGTIKLNHEDILEFGPYRLQVQLRKPMAMD